MRKRLWLAAKPPAPLFAGAAPSSRAFILRWSTRQVRKDTPRWCARSRTRKCRLLPRKWLAASIFPGFTVSISCSRTKTGNAYLVEINPRSTQVGHLSLGPGRDIPAALYAALSGKAVEVAPRITEKDTIALFPQEWIRDAESPFLRLAYHDIPMEEPELIRDCVSNYQKQSAWYSRSERKPVSSVAKSSQSMAAPAKRHAVGLDWGRK